MLPTSPLSHHVKLEQSGSDIKDTQNTQDPSSRNQYKKKMTKLNSDNVDNSNQEMNEIQLNEISYTKQECDEEDQITEKVATNTYTEIETLQKKKLFHINSETFENISTSTESCKGTHTISPSYSKATNDQNIFPESRNQSAMVIEGDTEICKQATSKFDKLDKQKVIDSALGGLPTFPEQSYETLNEINLVNDTAKTLSFRKEETSSLHNSGFIDNEARFSIQNFEMIKLENPFVDVITHAENDQEISALSQADEISADAIGTSSFVLNSNSGLNEDETASSSYVPDTPENQERDQDQESAVSTSSYEILPCEELNIASSSITPDTSSHGEFPNIENNEIIEMSGITDLQTPTYSLSSNLNVAGIETASTSNFSNQAVNEQNSSTPCEELSIIVNLKKSSSTWSTNESSIHPHEHPVVITTVSQTYSKSGEKEISSFTEKETYSAVDYYGPKSSAMPSDSYHCHHLDSHVNSNSRHVTLQNDEATPKLYQAPAIFDKQCLEQGVNLSSSCVDSHSPNYTVVTSSTSRDHDLEVSSDPTEPAYR